ncbi:MAG: type I secretion system permease/ATPase [Hyphomicrobiaceae bacterium]|nr:type I secretion system permease/ATPase [Hyphomicrobiaceae bacterium]
MPDTKGRRQAPPRPRNPLAAVLASCRAAFIGIGLVSGIINVLTLTSSVFMMQVYDRVLGSQSVPTLVALSGIAVAAYLFQGWLDILRGRVLALIGERVDAEVGPKVHAAVTDLPLRRQEANREALQPFRQLEAVRGFLSGAGPVALFDMPWMPIYLLICFLLHPLVGLLTLAGALVLVCLTLLTEVKSKAPASAALEAQSERNAAADAAQRGAEAVRAMGMLPALAARWQKAHEGYLLAQRRANYVVGGLSATAKMLRLVLQSALLGLGGFLAIRGQISSGSIIAGSIIGSRALAPVDQAIASWRAFVAARQGYQRLNALLTLFPDQQKSFVLPPPTKTLVVEDLVVAAPGSAGPIVRRVSLKLEAGQALGIIGPSASGKSTLARALVGVWPPRNGAVMLDGAALDQWSPEAIGPSIGYLPQDMQLFDGTVAENIARFNPEVDSAGVIDAAKAAAFHEQVLSLSDGYNTRVGLAGAQLSMGQKQRLGLARALYGKPFLVVLDEPNSNLDAEGEAAVSAAIAGLKGRGAIAVVIAHRPSAIAAVDLILVMRQGEAVAFGPKEKVLAKTVQNAHQLLARSRERVGGGPAGGSGV